jgi:hypothetical protein
MSEWIYDRQGRPQIIVDGDRFLDRSGINTIGWINGISVFTLTGQHAGWFENGVLWDIRNRCIGFTMEATGDFPTRPDITETRLMPDIGKRPRSPTLADTPIRPERCDWSNIPLDYNFDDVTPLAPTFYDDIQGV